MLVDDPWPTPLLVPQRSSVRMRCKADSNSLTKFWSIDLASDYPSSVQFQFGTRGTTERLNADSVFELPEMMMSGNITTLGLLINDTVKNNGTVIHCNRGTLSSMSTLLVYSKCIAI